LKPQEKAEDPSFGTEAGSDNAATPSPKEKTSPETFEDNPETEGFENALKEADTSRLSFADAVKKGTDQKNEETESHQQSNNSSNVVE